MNHQPGHPFNAAKILRRKRPHCLAMLSIKARQPDDRQRLIRNAGSIIKAFLPGGAGFVG
jgi:hypothetical protein